MGFVLQDGLSPLHMASQKGHLDVVKTLIEAGANINQANKVSTNTYTCMTSKPVINTYLYKCDPSHTACRERCVKGKVDNGSYYFYVIIKPCLDTVYFIINVSFN